MNKKEKKINIFEKKDHIIKSIFEVNCFLNKLLKVKKIKNIFKL